MTVPSPYRLQRNRHDSTVPFTKKSDNWHDSTVSFTEKQWDNRHDSTVPFTQKYDNGHDYMVSLTEKHLDDRHDCTVAALREEQNKMTARWRLRQKSRSRKSVWKERRTDRQMETDRDREKLSKKIFECLRKYFFYKRSSISNFSYKSFDISLRSSIGVGWVDERTDFFYLLRTFVRTRTNIFFPDVIQNPPGQENT